MFKLTKAQCKKLDGFIEHYIQSENAATGSIVDSNANVTHKNVATLIGELVKPMMLQYNRHIRTNQIKKDFGEELATQYLEDIDHHTIYIHDETQALKIYCESISLFPFLMYGSTCIGGNTEKPKHLSSFCGGFINVINQLASQVAGAIATPSFLICFDYFARKDYGDDYLNTHKRVVEQELQHVTFYLNEPSSGRDSQSVFWNVSIFDDVYMKALYSDFVYPDESFSKVNFKSVKALQKFFLKWLNSERSKKLLTFPVVTCAMIYDENKQFLDKEFKSFLAEELADGNSFFIYQSDNVDSLSSCCRLRNESKNEFSYTLGNVGEMTGSVHVISMNMNRIIQDCSTQLSKNKHIKKIKEELENIVSRIHRYHKSTRNIYENLKDSGMYPAYNANFIDMNRQFSTIGINGLVEAAEYLGFEITPNDEYMNFCSEILKVISDANKEAKILFNNLFNTEFIPGENAGLKNSSWDKKDGYVVPRECYNSYFYKVEDDTLSVLDKAKLHGRQVTQYLDGGSAYHINLEQFLTKEQYEMMFDNLAKIGVEYFCYNVMSTCCDDCGAIDKRTLQECSKCGSMNIDYATRIIGFLKMIKHFSAGRKKESGLRFYHQK